MIKIYDNHQYMTITSNGFIVLHNDFGLDCIGRKSSIDTATILSNDLIFVESVYICSFTNINILCNNINNDLSFGFILTNRIKNLINYHYVKKDNYIYKVPNNNFVMLTCLSNLSFVILSSEVVKTHLVNDCNQLIIPFLFDLIRLDYDSYNFTLL